MRAKWAKIVPFWATGDPPQAAKNTPKMTKNGHNLAIFGPNDVYRMYFAEKISWAKFDHVWSCLVVFTTTMSRKMAYRPFFDPCPPQNAKVTKNDKIEFSGQKNHFDHMRITILHQIC